MKAVIIKGLSLPTVEGSFIDVRIQDNGKALMVGCMGRCTTYEAEEIDLPEEEK